MTGTKSDWNTLRHTPTRSPLQILEEESYGRTYQGGIAEGEQRREIGLGKWTWKRMCHSS